MQFFEGYSDGIFEMSEDWLVECILCGQQHRIDRRSLNISVMEQGDVFELFFYDEDFNYLRHPMNAEMVNKNMNDAASDMRKKGIQMVFMPCVDKFDLYYPYLNEKDKARWPENTVFEDLDKLPKEYTFVNTKMLLRPLLAENTKDVYWQDDTHWSWKAFQIVVDAMMQDLVIK